MKKIISIITTMAMLITSLYAVTLAWCPIQEPWVAGYAVRYSDGPVITNWTPTTYILSNTNDPCSIVSSIPGTNWYLRYTTRVDAGTNTTISITNLTPGVTYYFVAVAYTADGQENPPSNEISYTIPVPINPSNLPPTKVQYFQTIKNP